MLPALPLCLVTASYVCSSNALDSKHADWLLNLENSYLKWMVIIIHYSFQSPLFISIPGHGQSFFIQLQVHFFLHF